MFKVTTSGQTVLMSAKQLADALVAKTISSSVPHKTKASIDALTVSMANKLESQGLLKESTPMSILALGISVGYYLNTFLRKNNVELEEQNDEDVDSNTDDQSGS